jgi:hypothetical protein
MEQNMSKHNESTDDSKNDQPVQSPIRRFSSENQEFKNAIKTWTNRRASNQMKRVTQMEENREIHDMMHMMNEDSGKKASEVSQQMTIYSNKTKANQRDINSFIPSKAFYIMGHGGVTHDTFIVPVGHIIVVKVAEGEIFYQTNKYIPIMCGMDISILTDPIRRRAELVEALGSVAIYLPGSTCPNFRYFLVDDIKSKAILSEFGSGVTDIGKYKEDPRKLAITHSIMNHTIETFQGIQERNNPEEIKKFIADAYQYSICPTKNEVETVIDHLETNTNMRGIITKLKQNPLFFITQKDLCDKSEGVFYNFVCRPNDVIKPFIIQKHINNEFTVNKLNENMKGLLTLKNSPAPFDTPNNIRSYSSASKRNKLQAAKNELQAAKKNYRSLTYRNYGTPEYYAFNEAYKKYMEVNKKVKYLENNTRKKELQSRIGESHVFRRPGIRNMIASTTTNAKLLQKYRNELEEVLQQKEKNRRRLSIKNAIERNTVHHRENTNALSKIQNRIYHITNTLEKNGKENKNHLSKEKNELEKEYKRLKRTIMATEGLIEMRRGFVRNIEKKYNTHIKFLEREIGARMGDRGEARAEGPFFDGGRTRLRHTRKR